MSKPAWLVKGRQVRITQRVLSVEQELLTALEHLSQHMHDRTIPSGGGHYYNPTTVYWCVCTKPRKWTVMCMCVMVYILILFYDFPIRFGIVVKVWYFCFCIFVSNILNYNVHYFSRYPSIISYQLYKSDLKSDSTHHFFRNACTKSGSLQFSQFSGCWLILSVYILMSFDFPFGRLFGVR